MKVSFIENGQKVTEDYEEISLSIASKDIDIVPSDKAFNYIELDDLFIHENAYRVYTPDNNGFSSVQMDVSFNLPSLDVEKNGVYTPKNSQGFSSVYVSCPEGTENLRLEDLEVSKNGVYKPKAPINGFESVYVDVIIGYDFDETEIFNGGGYVADKTSRYVFYKGELHQLGGESTPRRHLVYRNNQWVSDVPLPYNFIDGGAVETGGKLHIMGGLGTDVEHVGTKTYTVYVGMHHYSFDGETWKRERNLPISMYRFSVAVDKDNYVYLIGGLKNLPDEMGEPQNKIFKTALSYTDDPWRYVAQINVTLDRPPALFQPDGVLVIFAEGMRYELYELDKYQSERQVRIKDSTPFSPNAVFYCDDGMSGKIHILNGYEHQSWNGVWWKAEQPLLHSVEKGAQILRYVEEDEGVLTEQNAWYILGQRPAIELELEQLHEE